MYQYMVLVIKLVRFAHNWNVGIMGSGKLRELFVGKIILTRHVTNEKVPPKTSSQRRIYIIPPFHYSMCEAKAETSQKSLYFNKLYNFRDVSRL